MQRPHSVQEPWRQRWQVCGEGEAKEESQAEDGGDNERMYVRVAGFRCGSGAPDLLTASTTHAPLSLRAAES